MVAPEDVIAEIPFSVPKTPAELERERSAAIGTVPLTFRIREEADDTVVARLGRFFDELDSAVVASDTLRLSAILQGTRITVTPSQLSYIVDDESRALLRDAAERATRELLPRGVVDPDRISNVPTGVITVREGGADERSADVEEVLTSLQFVNRAIGYLPRGLPPEAGEVFRLVLLSHLGRPPVDQFQKLGVAASDIDDRLISGRVFRDQPIGQGPDVLGPDR